MPDEMVESRANFLAGQCLAVEVDGDVFLVRDDDGETYRLGGAGSRYWALLTAGRSLSETADAVALETGGELAIVRSDLARMVAELERIGALVRR